MKRKNVVKVLLILLITALLLLVGCKPPTTGKFKGIDATVYKSPTCGCCGIFAKYIQKEGFSLDIVTTKEMDVIKERYNIPANLESCHTTIIEGYVIEGHIPVEVIDKLLEEKPDIKGIAMPGMPSGSPGMPGQKRGEWVIYAIHHDGSTTEYMRL